MVARHCSFPSGPHRIGRPAAHRQLASSRRPLEEEHCGSAVLLSLAGGQGSAVLASERSSIQRRALSWRERRCWERGDVGILCGNRPPANGQTSGAPGWRTAAAYVRIAMGAEAAGPRTAPQVSAARWSAHPVVRRDRQRYNQTCRDAPVPASSLARVLLVDGRCVCINNGIGNLFGDYTVWFVAAALSGRRLFIDWKDTATNETVFRSDEAECLASTGGARCRRVHKRFDLSEWFSTLSGHSWR